MKRKRSYQRAAREKRGGSSKAAPSANSSPVQGKISANSFRAPKTIAPRRELLLEPGELPVSYGITSVVLIPVEPYLANVYWDVSPSDREKIGRRLAVRSRPSQPVLRFHDVTGHLPNKKSPDFFDIEVDLRAGNWYVHLWSPGKSYFAELGLRSATGRFFPVARSNTAEFPAAGPLEERYGRTVLLTGDNNTVNQIAPETDTLEILPGPVPPPLLPELEIPPVPAEQCRELPRDIISGVDLAGMSERNFFFGISSGSSLTARKTHGPIGD
jgi:hypothetical protein